MLFLIAFVGAAIIALVLWKAMNASHGYSRRRRCRAPSGIRVSGPDDDPDFVPSSTRRSSGATVPTV